MKKTYGIALLSSVLLMGSLTGCGQQAVDPYAGRIKIRFLQNTNKTLCSPFIEAAAKKFNDDPELNPGLKYAVDATQDSGGYDDLISRTIDNIATDNYCDILYGYPDNIQKCINRSIVYDLDEFIYDEEIGLSDDEIADIIPDYLEEGQNYTVEGTYSMPFSKSSEVMYTSSMLMGISLAKYDATINNGNPINKAYLNNLTWDELFEKLCPAIMERENDPDVPADKKLLVEYNKRKAIFAYDSDDNFFITLAQQYGYDYTELVETASGIKKGEIKFANTDIAKLLLKFNDYYKKGYLITGGTYGGEKHAYTSDLFNNKACLFTVSSTAGAKNTYNSLFTTVPLRIPHVEREVNGQMKVFRDVISQGPSIAILDHGDKERAKGAWLFYKYFLYDRSTMWSVGTQSGYLPILASSLESEEYQDACSTEGKEAGTVEYNLAVTYQYQTQIANDLFSSPVFDKSGAARTQAGSAMKQALLKEDATLENIYQILVSCVNIAKNS